MKKLVSLLLALVMLFSLAACNQTPADDTKAPAQTDDTKAPEQTDPIETEPPEPVKITLFPANANVMSGIVGGWKGEFLAEHGIILEIMAHSEDKLNAILAGGDLPDIIYLPGSVDYKDLSESGMFMDMEPYLDQMPAITSNETYMAAIDYTKQFITEGALTVLPQNVGPAGQSTTSNSGVKLNWEIYQQIGCPEFKNLDELVDVLKQMKEACPTAPDGTEMYAMRMFNNMDSSYFYSMMSTLGGMGYGYSELKYGIETNHVDKSWDWIFDDNSAYYQSAKFFNKLYKEDLLDPDSISTDRSTQHNKQVAGGSLATWQGVPGYEGQGGYYPAYYEDYTMASGKLGYPFGASFLAVSAETENLETVLAFLNMSADPECVRTLQSLPQGEFWDHDSDNNLVLTEKGQKALLKGEEVYIGDEKYVYFNTIWLIHPNTLHPVDGETVNVASSKTYQLMNSDTDMQKQWAEHYGYSDIITMLEDKGQRIATFDEQVSSFAATPDDDQNLIIAAAKEIIVNGTWKMVYAQTDAEFEQIWEDMIEEIDALGFKDIYNWRVNALKEGMAIRDSLLG